MSKIIICQGIPASGKTTWVRKFCNDNPTYIRVNRDDLRRMRGCYWAPNQESLITDFERNCIFSALKRKFNVIVDSTNINKKFVSELVSEIKLRFSDSEIAFKFFDISLEEAIERDKNRQDPVGEEVIKKMYNDLVKLKNDEGLVLSSQKNNDEQYIQDSSLPHCVICDIDGTLAIKGDRGQFDFSRVELDTVNKPVSVLIDMLKNCLKTIIFVSGRDEICRQKTENWLNNNNLIPSYQISLKSNVFLFMRKSNDMRKDYIIKKEIFDMNIKNKYFVEFVLDDRNQTVEMWRNLGIPCFQVNYGDF